MKYLGQVTIAICETDEWDLAQSSTSMLLKNPLHFAKAPKCDEILQKEHSQERSYYYLLVVLVRNVDPVDLDDPVPLPEPRRLRRAARVHLAHELAGAALLGVQVKAVAVEVVPLGHVGQPRSGGGGGDHHALGPATALVVEGVSHLFFVFSF